MKKVQQDERVRRPQNQLVYSCQIQGEFNDD